MSELHAAARAGFANAARAYVRGRPDYPPALLGWLRGTLGLDAGKSVLDLGAGTGKFTTLLRQTGALISAVEPVESMRAQLNALLPDVRALPGTAQAIPLHAAAVDVVVCAQAFHWFASEAALLEIHRVLKPQGRLGLVWNVRDESVDWVASCSAIMAPYEGDTPRFYRGEWRCAFAVGLFTDLEQTCWPHWHVGSAQHVIIDRCLSVSFIAALPERERDRVAERLRALIVTHPALKDRPQIEFPYQTRAYHCTRCAIEPRSR